MSSQIFPNIRDIMLLLLAELPENVYPTDLADSQDPDKRSISSSELRAHAAMILAVYDNLKKVNADKFIATVTPEGAAEYERQLFSSAQDATGDFEERKAKLVAKLRSNRGISMAAIRNMIAGILDPKGIEFEISPWCGPNNGAWILDDTELETGTYLTPMDPIMGNVLDKPILECDLDYEAVGITLEELTAIQNSAYMYEVRIYGDADPQTIQTIDEILTHFEPARAGHLILNNHQGRLPVPEPEAIIEWNLDDSILDENTWLTSD